MSVDDRIGRTVDGMRRLFDALNPSDLVETKSFNKSVRTHFKCTSKRKVRWDKMTTELIQRVSDEKGLTSLFDAIMEAIKTLSWSKKHSEIQREIVVFTDGADNASKTSFGQCHEVLSTMDPGDGVVRSNVKVTIIGAGISSSCERKMRELVHDCPHARFELCGTDGASIVRTFETVTKQIIHRRELVMVEMQHTGSAHAPRHPPRMLEIGVAPPSHSGLFHSVKIMGVPPSFSQQDVELAVRRNTSVSVKKVVLNRRHAFVHCYSAADARKAKKELERAIHSVVGLEGVTVKLQLLRE